VLIYILIHLLFLAAASARCCLLFHGCRPSTVRRAIFAAAYVALRRRKLIDLFHRRWFLVAIRLIVRLFCTSMCPFNNNNNNVYTLFRSVS